MPIEDDDALRALLEAVSTIAVVGMKAGETDEAFKVPRYMRAAGYRILPVSPKLEWALGERCVPQVGALEVVPDLVNVFRAGHHIPGHVEEFLALPVVPRAVWLQLGIRHPSTARLEAAGIAVVEDRCLMVEHARLFGGRPAD